MYDFDKKSKQNIRAIYYNVSRQRAVMLRFETGWRRKKRAVEESLYENGRKKKNLYRMNFTRMWMHFTCRHTEPYGKRMGILLKILLQFFSRSMHVVVVSFGRARRPDPRWSGCNTTYKRANKENFIRSTLIFSMHNSLSPGPLRFVCNIHFALKL